MNAYFNFDALFDGVVHEEAVRGIGTVCEVVRIDIGFINSDGVHKLFIMIKYLEQKCVVVEEVPSLT